MVDPTLDPVLLVPGIAGSILEAVDEEGNKERVWVRILAAEHEFREKLWSKFDASTGTNYAPVHKLLIMVYIQLSITLTLDFLLLNSNVINVLTYFTTISKKNE